LNKIILSTIATVFLIAFIPMASLLSSDLAIRNRVLNETSAVLKQSDSEKYGYDNKSKKFLKSHPYLSLRKITNNQGVDCQGEYFIGQTKNNKLIRIYIKFASPNNRMDDFNPVLRVNKIQVMQNASVA